MLNTFGPTLYNQINQVIKITHRASDSISCISVLCSQCPVLFLMEYVKKTKKAILHTLDNEVANYLSGFDRDDAQRGQKRRSYERAK